MEESYEEAIGEISTFEDEVDQSANHLEEEQQQHRNNLLGLDEMEKALEEIDTRVQKLEEANEGLKKEVSEQSMRFKGECAQLGENLEEKLKKNWRKLEDYVKELSQLRGDAKVSASSMPSPQEKDSRIEIRADAVEETYTETPLSREQPSVRETSAFVESPEDDLALIEELRNRTVTQRIARLCQAHIGNCWRTLGIFFKIDESILNNIETDFPTAEEKGFKVLEIWRDKEGRSATVRCLEDALIEIGKRRIAENILDIVREERVRESKQKGDRSKEDEPNRLARLENVREKNQPKLKTRGGSRKLENESERVKRLENVRRDNVENRKPAAGESSKTRLKMKRSKSSGATK